MKMNTSLTESKIFIKMSIRFIGEHPLFITLKNGINIIYNANYREKEREINGLNYKFMVFISGESTA